MTSCFYHYLMASFSDPGVLLMGPELPKNPNVKKEGCCNHEGGESESSSEEEESEITNIDYQVQPHKTISLYKERFCYTCNTKRPPFASHCSFCNHCVSVFDHHCTMINSCVGQRNLRNFVLTINLISLANFLYCSIFAGGVVYL